MSDAVQQLAALAIVLGAAAYVSRRAWRAWRVAASRRRPGCGSGCGCD